MELEKLLEERESGFYKDLNYLRKRITELECKNCEVSRRRMEFLKAEIKALEKYLEIAKTS